MKKKQVVVEICKLVQVERRNPTCPNLTFDELLYVLSWLSWNAEMANAIDRKMKGEQDGNNS